MARINFGFVILESENTVENVPSGNEILDFSENFHLWHFYILFYRERSHIDSPKNLTLICFFSAHFLSSFQTITIKLNCYCLSLF